MARYAIYRRTKRARVLVLVLPAIDAPDRNTAHAVAAEQLRQRGESGRRLHAIDTSTLPGQPPRTIRTVDQYRRLLPPSTGWAAAFDASAETERRGERGEV